MTINVTKKRIWSVALMVERISIDAIYKWSTASKIQMSSLRKKFLLCARIMCVLKRMYRVFLNKFYFTSQSFSLSTQSSCMHNLPHFPQISNGWDFEIKLFFEWPVHWQPKYNHFVHYFHRRGIEFSHYGPCMNTSATAEKCPSSCARSLLSGAVCGSNGNVYPSECDMKRQTCG